MGLAGNHKIGQILFIGSNKKNQVVPVQVVERLTKETVDGKKIIYSVITSNNPEKTIDLERINGQIFTSLEEAKNKMTINAERASREMIVNAEKASQDLLSRARQEIDHMVQVAAQAAQKFPQYSSNKFDDDDEGEDLSIDLSDVVVEEEKEQKEKKGKETDKPTITVPLGPNDEEVPVKVRSVQFVTKE